MTTATEKLTIDPADITTLQEAIRSGLSTPELLAEWLPDACEIVDACLVVEPDTWHATDCIGCEITYTADDDVEDGADAAKQYVEDGDWGDRKTTIWVSVHVWREAIDEDGDIVKVDENSHTIAIDPESPECHDGGDHKWCRPHDLVGGCEENPGCWGSGGGVKVHSVCLRCGCGCLCDSWAQNPETGEQGLDSTEYTEDEYTESLEAIAEKCGERIGEAIAEDADSGDEWPGIRDESIDDSIQGLFRESIEEIAEAAFDAAMKEASE